MVSCGMDRLWILDWGLGIENCKTSRDYSSGSHTNPKSKIQNPKSLNSLAIEFLEILALLFLQFGCKFGVDVVEDFARIRHGSLAERFSGGKHFLFALTRDAFAIGLRENRTIDQVLFKSRNRAFALPLLHIAFLAIHLGLIGGGVIAHAIGETLDERGTPGTAPGTAAGTTAPGTGAAYSFLRCGKHREHIVAIHANRRNAETDSTLREPCCRGLFFNRHRNRPAVVF